MLTYAGRGYSPAFCENFDRIAERIGGGEDIRIVAGPDDVCAPLLEAEDRHCHDPRVTRRDTRAAEAISALLGRPVAPGAALSLDPALLDRLRDAFAAGRIRDACAGCEWTDLCDGIADAGFDGTRLPNGR